MTPNLYYHIKKWLICYDFCANDPISEEYAHHLSVTFPHFSLLTQCTILFLSRHRKFIIHKTSHVFLSLFRSSLGSLDI